MENAKKNLVFHFGVGRQASPYQIEYVKFFGDDDNDIEIKFHAPEVDLHAIFFVKSQIVILHSVISRVFCLAIF